MRAVTNPHLPALAADGRLAVGIPLSHGGAGGGLADLFHAVAQTAAASPAAGRIYAVQRHFAEVLLSTENVAVAEHRLPYILEGHISGACTVTWPEQALAPLSVRAAGSGFVLRGPLHPVPNVGEGWYLVTALLQLRRDRPPSLALLSSEQDRLHRAPSGSSEGDDCATLTADDVFFRGDEILQEDAGQQAAYLRRFATFLRCAIAAGIAKQAVQRMDTGPRTAGRATLTRTINQLLRGLQGRNLPAGLDLQVASSVLDRLGTAACAPAY